MELVETATDQYQSRTTTLLQNETGTSPGPALLQSSELVGVGQSGSSLSQDSSSDSLSTDMLDDMENGNKTPKVEEIPENQTSPQPKSILDTPWRIFLPETSIADLSRTASSHTASSDSGPHITNPKMELPSENGCHGDSAARTETSNGGSTLNIGPPGSNSSAAVLPGVASTSNFQFNIKATEFVPTFQFSLNVNAMEFTPNVSPSSANES